MTDTDTVTYGAASVLTWDTWFRLNGLTYIQHVACRRCTAKPNEPCLALTGITASEPCAVRVADAASASGPGDTAEAAASHRHGVLDATIPNGAAA